MICIPIIPEELYRGLRLSDSSEDVGGKHETDAHNQGRAKGDELGEGLRENIVGM